ncbi:centromere protein X [Halteromyces radiatus]|uniref:centromere protein X n=1 Tax=Halteromyces radiatus TaxID=101107 RepID=UPI00221E6443|nr:centromere protein X [Halteromyces radiatus]KAI8078760.1 centromere protein X [Halteromyces radiatus]
MEDSNETTFSPNTIQAVIKHGWKDTRTKANAQALQLSAEFFRLFTIEAIHRASEEAERSTGSSEHDIQVEHLEKILTQLMLDF